MTKQLGLAGAVAIGLASMVGAGVFVVFREAYAISPGGFFLALAIAALVASLNAASVYSLASAIERPGGIYSYARVYLSDTAGFIAGLSFVAGKIGSIAAIALVIAEYLAAGNKLVAIASILVLTTLNLFGINRTALAATIISAVTIGFLLLLFGFAFGLPSYLDSPHREYALAPNFEAWPILQAASIFFFAFAGYARVATLGSEVRKPKRNIPSAMVIALATVVALYFALAWQLERVFGFDLHALEQPIATLAKQVGFHVAFAVFVVLAAALGSMLALLAGVSRTLATMSEDLEMPKFFAARNRFGAPARAELAIAVAASALVFLPSLGWVVGISSFFVLTYYAIGHLSALKQGRQNKLAAVIGLLLCGVIAIAVPGPAAVAGSLIILLGLAARKLLNVW